MTLPNITMICEHCKAVTEIQTIIFTTKSIEVSCNTCDRVQVYHRKKEIDK